jgi:hypothetical protein
MMACKLMKLFSPLAFLSFSMPAFAYIDPGTGGMMVQAFLALIASTIFYFRNPSQLWSDLKSWIKKKLKL